MHDFGYHSAVKCEIVLVYLEVCIYIYVCVRVCIPDIDTLFQTYRVSPRETYKNIFKVDIFIHVDVYIFTSSWMNVSLYVPAF